MSDLESLKSILEFVGKFVSHDGPNIDVSLARFNLAENFNINIHFERKEDFKSSSALITSRIRQDNAVVEERSVVILPETNQTKNSFQLTTQEAHFSTGTYIMVNQASWWTDRHPFIQGQLQIIPVLIDYMVTITTLEPGEPRRFRVCLNRDDELTLEIFLGAEKKIISLVDSSQAQFFHAGNSKWIFTKYPPDQIIRLEDLPGIILSFDVSIVKRVVMIKREHEVRENEYYVLLCKDWI